MRGGMDMGYTLSEKLLARGAGRERVQAGDIIWTDIDKAMMEIGRAHV